MCGQPTPCSISTRKLTQNGTFSECKVLIRVATQRRWTLHEQILYIIVQELLAILYSLQAVCWGYKNCHLRVITDNTTTMLCINNQGSTLCDQCNYVAKTIQEWAYPEISGSQVHFAQVKIIRLLIRPPGNSILGQSEHLISTVY